jgi:hypothetical protein
MRVGSERSVTKSTKLAFDKQKSHVFVGNEGMGNMLEVVSFSLTQNPRKVAVPPKTSKRLLVVPKFNSTFPDIFHKTRKKMPQTASHIRYVYVHFKI